MNSFGAKNTFTVGTKELTIFRLDALEAHGYNIRRLPYSLKILLENLLRHEDGDTVTKSDIEALASWDPKASPSREIQFRPARVLMQDFTGVPCVVDLAAMRDAMAALGGDPKKINPLVPVELVIDHSVQVDAYGSPSAIQINIDHEFERNRERYEFLKWGQQALDNFKVVPPNTGICHQVNLEYLARGVFAAIKTDTAYPDTLVGTDSHTTMINGLGVLGWGVGGVEAEAAMLGQPVSMLIPEVVGFRLTGTLKEGSTTTDLVLTVTEMLRAKGVVGKFVEFYGEGALNLPVADRATIGNMAPEYGATCGIFPVDQTTLNYMHLTGRSDERLALVESYMREQGLFLTSDSIEAEFSDTLELDLGTVVPSVAGPKRPQDRVLLGDAPKSFQAAFGDTLGGVPAPAGDVAVLERPKTDELTHGSIVIASITSCTNTSNPSVMLAAALLAKKAADRGLQPKPWVKTSIAPGSRVATEYFVAADLMDELQQLGFDIVGYGCMTCIGNSGPLPDWVSKKIQEENLAAVSVLSGNRNFEGRINAEVKANYLMSPPLVVAYALAGSINVDITTEPLGKDHEGVDVYLADVWPTQAEVSEVIARIINRDMFVNTYAHVYQGDQKWSDIGVEGTERFSWDKDSTYIKNPPYFEGMQLEPRSEVPELSGMRCLALLGDSITTDHISPAGNIKASSPAGQYLIDRGVQPYQFNSYGARRGNSDVMVRGTFANIRLRNQLAPGTEGGFTTYLPTGEVTTIYDAAMRYTQDGTDLIVIAGKEYGTGSSRDWAAKGTALLGVKAVLAEGFERIHRSNLIALGVVPLEFLPGEGAVRYLLNGSETFDVIGLREGIASSFADSRRLTVRATRTGGSQIEFPVNVRIDTPGEVQYYLHGGILPYVLRNLLKS